MSTAMGDSGDGLAPQGGATRAVRSARIIRAMLALPDGEQRDVIVRNLSTCGLGATCRSLAPMKGEHVTIHLPGEVAAHGVVRWVKGQAFGVALDQDLDIAVIEGALQRRITTPSTDSSWEVEARHKVYTPRVDPTTLRRV
ncbi:MULTISPECIES: PilZ domain-containing protein [Novosphingobium]|uniref:PilZ domain-containing protein n=1 Tax=Novosphingobium TaxID=165696 RepID=UPI001CD4B87D|nr:PilZ domain-containing protein [Novosphingobium percolationis]MCH7627959.1 hypothetical protein [Pseudomonadota bacterium]